MVDEMNYVGQQSLANMLIDALKDSSILYNENRTTLLCEVLELQCCWLAFQTHFSRAIRWTGT